jgi:hypothetical protein
MDFYAYRGNADLGQEKLGTDNRAMLHYKTNGEAVRRCLKKWPDNIFRLYSYTNFYNDKTFKEIEH